MTRPAGSPRRCRLARRMSMSEAQIAESARQIIDQERDTLMRTSWSRSHVRALRAWRELEQANGGDLHV